MSAGRYAGALLLGVALTACSSGSAGEPRVLEPLPSASATTPTPTPTAAPLDLDETVRAYYGAVSAAYTSGDTSAARALIVPACPCTAELDGIDAIAERGETVEGSAYTVREVRVAFEQPDAAGVDIVVDLSAGVLRDVTGKVKERTPARAGRPLLVTLGREGESWRVASIDDRS